MKYTTWVLLLFLCFSSPSWAKGGIVSLKPNITEILFALGLGNQLVGVTTYCDYPEEAKKIPKVADYVHVDVEKVMALAPDLIVNSKENDDAKEVNFLKERFKVLLYPFGRLSEVGDSIKAMSHDLQVGEKGNELVGSLQAGLDKAKAQLKIREEEKVLLVVGSHPLVVVGGNNFLDDILQFLGVSNVARNSRLRYPTYSVEQLIASAPTVILDMTMGSEKANSEKSLQWYQQYVSVPAVKNNRVYFIDMGDFRASPRLVLGVEELVELLNK